MQFVLPDTAQTMTFEALDADGKRVDLLAGTADILDSTVATLDGLRILPRSPGSTIAGIRVGNISKGTGVHVYQRVSTLDGLRPEQHQVAVQLRLASGEVRRWHLPAGEWMLTMLPEADEATGIRLRVEGANCSPMLLTRRRYGCLVKNDASLIVYNPFVGKSAQELTGQLLVFRTGNP
jgi:hypothetical protein